MKRGVHGACGHTHVQVGTSDCPSRPAGTMRAVMPEDNDAEAIAPRRDTQGAIILMQSIHAPRMQHERGEEAHVTNRTRFS